MTYCVFKVINEVSNEEQILTELLSTKRYLFVNKK